MTGKGKRKKLNDTQPKKVTALKQKGKVFFDSDTFDVRKETTVEFVKRISNKRHVETEVQNKGQDARVRLRDKNIEVEKRLFNSKHKFIVHEETKHLKYNTGLKAVLEDLRDEYPRTDPRRYGLDKEDLKLRIQQKLLEMDPVKQRYRAAQNLLHMRPPPLEINKEMSTDQLLKQVHERRVRRAAFHLDTGRATSNDRLETPVLPNIVITGVTSNYRLETPVLPSIVIAGVTSNGRLETPVLPSIVITGVTSNDRLETPVSPKSDNTRVTSNDRHVNLLLPNINITATKINSSAIETDGQGDRPMPKQTHGGLIMPHISLNHNVIENKQPMPNSKKNRVSNMFITQKKPNH